MIFKPALTPLKISFAAFLLSTSTVEASPRDSLKQFWNDIGYSTQTDPGKYRTQSSGLYTMGSFHGRTPVKLQNLGSIQLPSARAGCGGIDVFAGAFSHIDSDQLIAFSKAVANNAAGVLLDIALETISPMIAEKMGQFRRLAEDVNQFNMNSCETASALVGAAWGQSDAAAKVICQNVGNGTGLFSDYAAARHGCATGGSRGATLNNAPTPYKNVLLHNINITWDTLKRDQVITQDHAEFLMSLVGTVIYKNPINDNQSPQIVFKPSLGINPSLVQALLRGGKTHVYRCLENEKCLDIAANPVAVTIPTTDGLQTKVYNLLSAILHKIVNERLSNQHLTEEELGLLNLTSLPVYKMLTVSAAYANKSSSFLELDTLGEVVSLELMFTFLEKAVQEVEKSQAAQMKLTPEQGERFRKDIAAVKNNLVLEREKIKNKINTTMELIERTQFMEKELASRLSKYFSLADDQSGFMGY